MKHSKNFKLEKYMIRKYECFKREKFSKGNIYKKDVDVS